MKSVSGSGFAPLLRNTRKTDTAQGWVVRKFVRGWGPRPAFALLLCVALAAPPPKSGIDADAIDKTCKPCDDFWRFANGAWLNKNPIPASRAGWGTMPVMAEGNRKRPRVILEAAALAKSAPGSNEQ